MAIASLLTVRATAGLPFTYYIKYDKNSVSLESLDGLPQTLKYEDDTTNGRIKIYGVPVILGEFIVTVKFSNGLDYKFNLMVTR